MCFRRLFLIMTARQVVSRQIQRLLLVDATARVALGSFLEARRDYLSVRCVSFGEFLARELNGS